MPASLRFSRTSASQGECPAIAKQEHAKSLFMRCRSHAGSGTALALAIALWRSGCPYALGIQRAWTFLPVLKAMIMEIRQTTMKQKIMMSAPVKLPVAS